MNVIDVKDLNYGYGKKNVFSAVSFSVQEGEFVKLTGPNGSGKSTLVKLLIKELDLQQGSIKLFGNDIKTFKGWQNLGYLPQSGKEAGFPATALEVTLTAFYKKRLFPFYTKSDKQNAFQALKRTGMENFADVRIGSLSGGQLQRVYTARLLAANPKLLILDEPMTGIDAETSDYLFSVYKDLTKDGVTVFMISHDITKRDEMFDRTFCLAFGNLIEVEKQQVIKEIQSMHTHPNKGEK